MRLSVLVVVTGLVIGCVDTDTHGPAQSVDRCTGDPTLEAIQSDVFTPNCAFASCHSGSNPAADLNLSAGHACTNLLNKSSCLFNKWQRVVPGHPEQSYLLNKLAGVDLGDNPDGPCATAANGKPQRMPLGAEPVCAGHIDQIRAWIAAGAPCGDMSDGGPPDGPVDGGVDGPPDAPDMDAEPPAAVVSLTALRPTVIAGDRTTATATLDRAAPDGGETVYIQVGDPTVLAVPGELFVPAGSTSQSFEIAGLRPSRPVLVRARAGGAWADATVGVSGLVLAEVFYHAAQSGQQWIELMNTSSIPIDLGPYSLGAGATRYTDVRAQLRGTVPAGECFVIGGPMSADANGDPLYSQVLDFDPDLPNAGSIGLFDTTAADLDPSAPPLDDVVYGASNTPSAPVGASLRRRSSGWVVQPAPMPNVCPAL